MVNRRKGIRVAQFFVRYIRQEKKINNMEIEKDNPLSEELINREPLEDTPFTIITVKEKGISFGALGIYKVTKDFKTPEEVKSYFKDITWNKIANLIIIINEIITKTK